MISLRGPKLKIFAGVLALICLAAGIYLTFFHSRGFVKTTAEILAIREDTTGDSTVGFPTVAYSVDGKSYTAELDTGSSSYRVGKTIPVLYDPGDPTLVHSGGGIGLYLMIVSAAILALVLVSTVKEKQRQSEARELRESSGRAAYAPSVQGEERELYFLTDLGTAKYGHRIEDAARRVLYEAKMTKFTLTQPCGFDFIDLEHGTVTPHLVGHEEETDWGDSILLDNHYTFELDGVDVWKHLKQNGVSVETNFDSGNGRLIGMQYRILRNGAEIARAETTGRYPHEEDEAAHKAAAALPVRGFFRVWTREQNLDLLFTVLLAFARSGASDDRGGSFGAAVGTLRKLRG